MKYYSEELKETFDTEDECLEAEKKYFEGIKMLEESDRRIKEEKASRAKEVQAAYENWVKAEKEYKTLRNDFIKDYGYFHATYSNSEDLKDFDFKKLVDEMFGFARIF